MKRDLRKAEVEENGENMKTACREQWKNNRSSRRVYNGVTNEHHHPYNRETRRTTTRYSLYSRSTNELEQRR